MSSRPFISYAREDAEVATRMYRDLRTSGIEPWLDREKLRGGEDWEAAISNAIRTCSHFLALLSTHSVNKKGFVQKELRFALDILETFPPGEIFIIPIRIDESRPRHSTLTKLHWIDLFPTYEAGFARVLRSLAAENASGDANVAGPDLSARTAEYARDFMSEDAVLQMVIDRSQGVPKPLDRPLLLFSNAFQQTWLIFTTRTLTLVLDDLRKPAVYDPLRWQCRRFEALPVKVEQDKPTLGVIHFGSQHAEWLYSVKLHPSPEDLQRRIEAVLFR